MILRYDFGKTLDLSKFIKQIPYYLDHTPEGIQCDIFIKDYKLKLNFNKFKPLKYPTFEEGESQCGCVLELYDIVRDSDGQIEKCKKISPHYDVKFSDLNEIKSLFEEGSNEGRWSATSTDEMIKKTTKIIKILTKLNSLKLFY